MQLLRVAVDAAGRPFANAPKIQNARDASEWLRAVIEKSAAPPLGAPPIHHRRPRPIEPTDAAHGNGNTSDEDEDDDYEEGDALARRRLERRSHDESAPNCSGGAPGNPTRRR